MEHTLLTNDHAQRTEDYVYNIPAPPRITLPPLPASDSIDGLFALGLSRILPAAVAEAQLQQYGSAPIQSWTYEMRQRAQHMLPYVLLGPMTVTKDSAWLQNEGVTMALGIRQGTSKILDAALKRCRNLNIESCSVLIDESHSLVSTYSTTTQIITNHLLHNVQQTGTPGKVLVFCESGNERSAAVVAAFIMATHDGVDHIRAMQLCQLQRFCANFNETIKHSLQSYWDILCAQRNISLTDNTAGNISERRNAAVQVERRSKKRALEDDVDMMDDEEAGACSRSRVAAPFASQLDSSG